MLRGNGGEIPNRELLLQRRIHSDGQSVTDSPFGSGCYDENSKQLLANMLRDVSPI